ncbi:MAG: steroid 5-alpha reductase family enzyme [Salibacteraceae bacterium]|jgi:steroid 5-alpha reductase family enzyme
MWKTVLLLLATLIAVPVFAYLYDTPPNLEQLRVMWPVVYTYIGLSAACFIVSSIVDNYSQVDKLWSVAPLIYAWEVAYLSHWDERMILIASVISIWGIRLTYNFGRRGGYSWKFWTGDEDYRWAVLRAKPEFQAPWKWISFNLFFISFYQMGLVMLIMFPMIKGVNGTELFWADYLLALLVVGFVIMEYFADHQQYKFQTEKYRRIDAKEDLGEYEHGFVNTGLWGIMRHPNYAAEQSVWIVIYFFSVTATGVWINWSVAGAILLVLLFIGSSNFSEEISASKYPKYKEYQKKVARFIPFLK